MLDIHETSRISAGPSLLCPESLGTTSLLCTGVSKVMLIEVILKIYCNLQPFMFGVIC